MFWVIRWTDLKTGVDHAIVVEAKTRAAAETIALKRDLPGVYIGTAEDADIAQARDNKRLWCYTRQRGLRCFGQPITTRQLVCLVLCGIWTIGIILQALGILRAPVLTS